MSMELSSVAEPEDTRLLDSSTIIKGNDLIATSTSGLGDSVVQSTGLDKHVLLSTKQKIWAGEFVEFYPLLPKSARHEEDEDMLKTFNLMRIPSLSKLIRTGRWPTLGNGLHALKYLQPLYCRRVQPERGS
jgi:hypothetical protein